MHRSQIGNGLALVLYVKREVQFLKHMAKAEQPPVCVCRIQHTECVYHGVYVSRSQQALDIPLCCCIEDTQMQHWHPQNTSSHLAGQGECIIQSAQCRRKGRKGPRAELQHTRPYTLPGLHAACMHASR